MLTATDWLDNTRRPTAGQTHFNVGSLFTTLAQCCFNSVRSTKQKQNVHPMLIDYWPPVYDVGLTINRHHSKLICSSNAGLMLCAAVIYKLDCFFRQINIRYSYLFSLVLWKHLSHYFIFIKNTKG